ncbi:hypothetical protein D3C81_905830 [compost metagenome]
MATGITVVGHRATWLAYPFAAVVIRPGRDQVCLGPADHAAQQVIGRCGDLVFCIRLAHQLTQHVIGIGPGAHVRVCHLDFTAAMVVDQGRVIA